MDEIQNLTDFEIQNRIKMLSDNVRIMKTEIPRINQDIQD